MVTMAMVMMMLMVMMMGMMMVMMVLSAPLRKFERRPLSMMVLTMVRMLTLQVWGVSHRS